MAARRSFEHFTSLVSMFFIRAGQEGEKPFLWAKRDGTWTPISWSEAARQVASLALALKDMGLNPGDRVMLVSENRPEWCIADLGIMAAGCITVPTYTTNGERDHQHIIEDSGASAVIVSTTKLAQAVMPAAIRATKARHMIAIEDIRVGQETGVVMHDWTRLVSRPDADVAACEAQAAAIMRNDTACIIYTSGTGGAPRGVKQHHGAILLNVEGCVEIISEDFAWSDEVFLSKTLRPKVQARFGGRMKAMVSGGAPLNPEVGIFFHAMGLTLLQGYGQTESGPVISCNRPKAGIRMDTVGPPLKGVEVKIADDGEILVRGELVMHGYWRNEAETQKALHNDWLHTGDIGEFDPKGRIRITDRKKDIIVNDKGENVAPQKIEGMLTLAPEIFQAMVSGDNRPHLVALVVPDPEWAVEWAQKNDIPYDLKALCDLPAFRSAVMAAVDQVNSHVTSTEKVRKIALIPDAFSIDNEMMTPSMKIRRHVIRKVYGAKIDGMYGS